MSAERRKGTGWETDIVNYLRANGAPNVERRALHGRLDRGDIAGLIGVVIEAKAGAFRADWVDEAEAERRNDRMAPVAVVWHKRRGKGSPGDGLVTMTGAQFLGLLRTSGYLPAEGGDQHAQGRGLGLSSPDVERPPVAAPQTPAAGVADRPIDLIDRITIPGLWRLPRE